MEKGRAELVKQVDLAAEKVLKALEGIQDPLIKAGAAYKAFMESLKIPFDHNSYETPFRVAKMMFLERCKALYETPPEFTTFEEKTYDEYVVVKDIPYYSLCSHHHVTFFGKAHICYLPNKKVLGISKFARVVYYFASKPQLQEMLTEEICNYIWKKLKPKGILVKIEGRHMCMESRGAKAVGTITVTQKLMGEIDKLEAEGLFA